MSNRKSDSLVPIFLYWLFFAAIILGASSCIMDDVIDEREAVAVCCLVAGCILLYVFKCVAQHFAEEEETELT